MRQAFSYDPTYSSESCDPSSDLPAGRYRDVSCGPCNSDYVIHKSYLSDYVGRTIRFARNSPFEVLRWLQADHFKKVVKITRYVFICSMNASLCDRFFSWLKHHQMHVLIVVVALALVMLSWLRPRPTSINDGHNQQYSSWKALHESGKNAQRCWAEEMIQLREKSMTFTGTGVKLDVGSYISLVR